MAVASEFHQVYTPAIDYQVANRISSLYSGTFKVIVICESAGLKIGSRDRSFARFHTCFHNGQSKAHTTCIAVSGRFWTKRGFEQLINQIFGDTGSVVADFNYYLV